MIGLKIQKNHSVCCARMNHRGKSRSRKPNLEAVAGIQWRYWWIRLDWSLAEVGEKGSYAGCSL